MRFHELFRLPALAAWMAALSAALVLGSCSDGDPVEPTGDRPSLPAGVAADVVPSDLWPFTANSPSMGDPADPINLIFVGDVGARKVRTALLALDGDRTPTFPSAFPFDCAWKDAMGAPQVAFSDAEGWTGGVIQLECGEYDPIRFHVRLFDLGDVTVANAHMDLLIPGTADHQVIAWEAAERLVTFDIARSGLLAAAPAQTGPFNPAPTYREIPAVIYNGIPVGLRAFIGTTPVAGDAQGPVGIVNDGSATVLTLASGPPEDPTPARRGLSVPFAQVIPNPFCSLGPLDFLRVGGSVLLTLEVRPGAATFTHHFRVDGTLDATPVDPLTGQATGPSFAAEVHENYVGQITDAGASLTGTLLRIKLPPSTDGRGRFTQRIHVGPEGPPTFSREEDCPGT